MAEGPLRDVRILDLTHVWAGPLAVRTLADLGAQVVKVEAPYGRGPRTFNDRPIAGWLGGDAGDEPWNRNAAFVKLMRNRQSLCLDLKQPSGRAAFLDLVAVADVVIENFSARAMPSLDLGYATLKAANPRIIYVTMPGYGTHGPYKDRVAFGPTVEPLSGLVSVMGYGPDDPRCTAMALMDPIAALSAASAVVTALRRREATGTGSYVELSLHEAGVSYSGPWLLAHQLGEEVIPYGNRHPQMAPHGVYRCAGDDAWVAIGCQDDVQWQMLCQLIGGGLDAEATLARRRAEHDAIDAAITAWTASRSRFDAASQLHGAGVPAGPVNITPDMINDPQVRHRGFFVPLEDRTPVPGTPVKMPGMSTVDWTPCPGLGADNSAVLQDWLGYSAERISDLQRSGVIADQPPG
jgi:crotonobetainyl-CoA:carnitine CoA-transferase CaiB-like acyl-CoA transferase